MTQRRLNFKRLFGLSWKQKWLLIGGMVATLFSVLLRMVFPILMGIIINALTYKDYRDAINGPMKAICNISLYTIGWDCFDNEIDLLNTGTVTVITLGFFSAFFAFNRWYLLDLAGERVVARLRNQLFHSIMFAEVGMFDVTKSGELVNRLSADTTELKNVCTIQLAQSINSVLNVILALIYVFYLSWSLTLVMLSVVPFVAISGRYFGMYYRKQSRITQDVLAEATDIASESISNVRTVKAFSTESEQEYLYAQAIFKTYTQGRKMAFAFGCFIAFVQVMANASMSLIVWFGAKQVIDGKLTAGDLGTYVIMSLQIGFALSRAVSLYSSIMKALGAGERTFKLIDRYANIAAYGGDNKMRSTQTPYSYSMEKTVQTVDDVYKTKYVELDAEISDEKYENDNGVNLNNSNVDCETAKVVQYLVRNMDQFDGNVIFNGVRFAYPSRREIVVLNNLNFVATPGQVTALVGESGGGKSTIVQLLLRFYDPIDGVISVDDIDLKQFDLKWLHKQIGYVSQEPVLFARSIKDNITFGLNENECKKISMSMIIDAAKKANAYDFVMSFPDKFDTLVGERGIRLSGGQKQRVAIARAILMNPKIILLDEATSALDTESEHLVQKALDSIINDSNKTVIIIAHRLSTVKNANQILVIQNGSVVEKGTHNQLIALDNVYCKLVQRQLFTK
eukprot:282823_1